MNTKVKEVCNIVGRMCILQATVVCVTVKFELRCKCNDDGRSVCCCCLYNTPIVFLVVSRIKLSIGLMGVFMLACSFCRVIALWLR